MTSIKAETSLVVPRKREYRSSLDIGLEERGFSTKYGESFFFFARQGGSRMSFILGEVLIRLVVDEPFAVITLIEGDDDDLSPPCSASAGFVFPPTCTVEDPAD